MKGLPPISSSSSQDSFFPSDGIWSCIEEREKEACCWLAHEWSSSIFKGLSLVLARKSVVTECKKWKRERRIISKDFLFLFCCLPWVNLTLAVCRYWANFQCCKLKNNRTIWSHCRQWKIVVGCKERLFVSNSDSHLLSFSRSFLLQRFVSFLLYI